MFYLLFLLLRELGYIKIKTKAGSKIPKQKIKRRR